MKYTIVILLLSMTSFRSTTLDTPFGNKYWVTASSTISPALDLNLDGKPDTDVLQAVPKCEIDDAIKLLPDGVLMTHRGKNHCFDDEEEEEEAGTWSYNPKTKVLTLDYDDSRRPTVMTLVEISSDRIVATSTHESSKSKHTIRAVFIPKK
jgi:hypothetical protein